MKLGLSILTLGLLFSSTPAGADPYRPRVGEPHPDFMLPAIDDRRPIRLSDYRGKKILLLQFASW